MSKKISLIGSTGSIGDSALNIIDRLKDYSIYGLSANNNVEKLIQQVKRYNPSVIVIRNEDKFPLLKENLKRKRDKILLSGLEGIEKLASDEEVDIVIIGMSSSEALYPLLKAVQSDKKIAIANKESIVMAGEIVNKELENSKAVLLPVDSEHSAIFQCLQGHSVREIDSLILTASGGPFKNIPREEFSEVKPEQAITHPRWNMGRKISVDSATLMNKAMEIVEAVYLFNISADRIRVLIHPQSIIHSMVEFIDGSIIALLSEADMRLAIQFAITYPERKNRIVKKLDFSVISNLSFELPDYNKFPALELGLWAAREKGTLPAIMNASNEVAVEGFMHNLINFDEIVPVVKKVMDEHEIIENPELEDIIKADRYARGKTQEIIEQVKT